MKRTHIIINKPHRDNRGQLASAIGHVAQSLAVQSQTNDALAFVDYVDADSNVYPYISESPVIALTTNATKIWSLWEHLTANNILRAAYLNTMMAGGSALQVSTTSKFNRHDLDPIVIGCVCDADDISRLTKKYSLYK